MNLLIWALVKASQALVMHQSRDFSPQTSPLNIQNVRRDGPDPGDFSWIKKWAAIGDSFTAGIGSGSIYSQRKEDLACSRYGHSYPVLVDRALGPSVSTFQFLACSGDRSTHIYDQVDQLENDMDLVMLTAGGNDLCLVRITTPICHLKEVRDLTII